MQLTRFPVGSACSLQVLDVEFDEGEGDIQETKEMSKENDSLCVCSSQCSARISRGRHTEACEDCNDRASPPESTELARRLRRSMVGEYMWHSVYNGQTAYKKTASAWLVLPTGSGTLNSVT